MELSKEHFDKVISGLATKEDVKATKDDLTTDISAFRENVDERIEEMGARLVELDATVDGLAGMVNRGFDDMKRLLDVREQVERHEREIEEMKRTLDLMS